MKKEFISYLLLVSILVIGCSIPAKVKTGSTEIVAAQKKFVEENNRFYDAILSTVSDHVEVTKSYLNEKIQTQISGLPKLYLDKMLKDRKKDKKAGDTATVILSTEDQLLIINTTMKSQETLLNEYHLAVDTLNERKKKIEVVINILKKFQGEIFNAMKSLDTYIQLQKFNEVLWEDTKNLIGGKNDKIDSLIKTIDSLNNN